MKAKLYAAAVQAVWLAALPLGCSHETLGRYDVGPLPPGGLPSAQTIESGVQVRVTPSGLSKVTSYETAVMVPEIDSAPACIAAGSTTFYSYCEQNDGSCTPGCQMNVSVSTVGVSVVAPQHLQIVLTLSASTTLPLTLNSPFAGTCTAQVSLTDVVAAFDVPVAIDPASGELVVSLSTITLGTATPSIAGCATLGTLVDSLGDLVNSAFTSFVMYTVAPIVQQTVAGLFPPGYSGTIDAKTLLGGAPAAMVPLEVRTANGGHVAFESGGLSFGVITGFNADFDRSTRTPALASEPAFCVPGLTPPDLSDLTPTARGTFGLPVVDAFRGIPDPTADVLFGVSERSLDLAGYHAVASGALCGTLDATTHPVLHQDALDDLLGVPLSPLGDGALRVTVQPTSGLDFAIPEQTTPEIDTALSTRLALELDAGAGYAPALELAGGAVERFALDLRQDMGPFEIEPLLAQSDFTSSSYSPSEARYATTTTQDGNVLFAGTAGLVLATLGPADMRFVLPTVGTFPVGSLGFQKVASAQSDFLAISGALQVPPAPGPATPLAAPGAVLLSVVSRDPASVRGALAGSGALPEVHIGVSGAAEYAWRFAGGAWHPWQATTELVISDGSFGWQGPRVIEIRARTSTTDISGVTQVPVVVDWAPPTIFDSEITVGTDSVTVPARDAVSGTALERAVTAVGAQEPITGYVQSDTLPLGALAQDGQVEVWVRDEAGHTASAVVQLRSPADAGAAGAAGSGGASGSAGAGGSGDAGVVDAGNDDAGDAAPLGSAADTGGCGCRFGTGGPRSGPRTLLFAALLAVVAARRRRRS